MAQGAAPVLRKHIEQRGEQADRCLSYTSIRIFTGDPAVIALTSRLMRIFFLGMVVFGLQMSFQQAVS